MKLKSRHHYIMVWNWRYWWCGGGGVVRTHINHLCRILFLEFSSPQSYNQIRRQTPSAIVVGHECPHNFCCCCFCLSRYGNKALSTSNEEAPFIFRFNGPTRHFRCTISIARTKQTAQPTTTITKHRKKIGKKMSTKSKRSFLFRMDAAAEPNMSKFKTYKIQLNRNSSS